MTGLTAGSEELTAAYIATWKGWSRITAWRWLKSLKTRYGEAVVRQRGRKLYTTRAGLAQVGEDLPPSIDHRVERRLSALEEAMTMSDRRQDGFANDLGELQREFRRRSHEWFKGRPSHAK